MKYIIDVPNQDYSYDVMLHTLKLKFYDDNLSCEVFLDAEPYTEPDRKAIEDEVWELADYMCKMSPTERCLCFGFSYSSEVYMNLTCQEAKAKFEKWMKNENEIHVGDEVFHKNYANDKGVVTRLYQSGYMCADILFSDGETDKEILVNNLVKTGRHFDGVVGLLEKMRGEEE